MMKSDINPMPEYYEKYIQLVTEDYLGVAFKNSLTALETVDINKFHKIGDKVYAPGKWTIKDILQHLIDSERVFSYRAMRFAREDSTMLPGYDENLYAKTADASSRNLESILSEFESVRASTMYLFESFSKRALLRVGTCNDKQVSVLGLGFTIIGHQIHHFNVMNDKYSDL
jgi:hypothetical protein